MAASRKAIAARSPTRQQRRAGSSRKDGAQIVTSAISEVCPSLLVLIVGLLLATTPARADDAAYCAALGDLAWRYIAGGDMDGQSRPDLETKQAIDECNKGNTA